MRRRTLLKTLLAPALAPMLVGALPRLAVAETMDAAKLLEDRVLGRADAPVTVIEYASFTCSHCARFHAETLPRLKTAYIDTGKVKFVFRDFPFDRPALEAGMMARCVQPERYFGLIGAIFQTQNGWSRAADPRAALAQLGRQAGIDQAAFDACVGNGALMDGILKIRLEGEQKHKIDSTPSFVIGDKKVSGALPFEEFEKLIVPLLPKS